MGGETTDGMDATPGAGTQPALPPAMLPVKPAKPSGSGRRASAAQLAKSPSFVKTDTSVAALATAALAPPPEAEAPEPHVPEMPGVEAQGADTNPGETPDFEPQAASVTEAEPLSSPLSPPDSPAVETMASRATLPVAAASEAAALVAASLPKAVEAATPDVTIGLPSPTRPLGLPAADARTTPANIPAKIQEKIMTTTEEFISAGQANVEAVVKSGQIWATGVQDLSRSFAESAQAQFEHTIGTWKALAGTRSLKEAFDIQSARARAALEKAVADGGKLTDASVKLAEQAFAPIGARLTVATEKLSHSN